MLKMNLLGKDALGEYNLSRKEIISLLIDLCDYPDDQIMTLLDQDVHLKII